MSRGRFICPLCFRFKHKVMALAHPVCIDCLKDPRRRIIAEEQIKANHPELLEMFYKTVASLEERHGSE